MLVRKRVDTYGLAPLSDPHNGEYATILKTDNSVRCAFRDYPRRAGQCNLEPNPTGHGANTMLMAAGPWR